MYIIYIFYYRAKTVFLNCINVLSNIPVLDTQSQLTIWRSMPYRWIRLNVTFKFSITLFAPLSLAAIIWANNTISQDFPARNLQVIFDSSFLLLAVPPSQPSSSKYLTLPASPGGTDTSTSRLVSVHLDAIPDSCCFPLTSPKPSSRSTALKEEGIRSCCSSL